ncbi:hypothetical protein J3E69DRAFT_358364 [Trichoderma sp. SZMC 28015]
MSKTSVLQEPQPPILKRDGFQLRKGVFSIDAIDRVEGSRLHELFKPSTLRLKRDQKAATEEARRLFRRPFFAAQLRYYGVYFPSSASKLELQALLQDAVRQGKCNHVPQPVAELEASMRADYEPLQRNERAAFDPQRFIDMYFLTDGEPDMAKTTEALALDGLDRGWKLQDAARKVPGLHTWGGGYLEARKICIGWNREEVFRLAKSIMDRQDEANRAQKEALWKEQLERHQKYVDQVQSKGANGMNQHSEVFNLDRCQGSYVVRCDEITEGWLDTLKGHTLTMDISSGKGSTRRAAYDFGIIEGTMILSLSEDAFQALDSLYSEASSGDENGEDEDQDDEDQDDEDKISTNGKKRKPGNDLQAQGTGHTSAKRRKTRPLPSPSRRVYFRLHGRETGEGEVLPYPDSGHIDYLSDDCTSFAGVVYDLTHVGNNVEFRGYRVSDKPRVKPEPWETFLFGRYGL